MATSIYLESVAAKAAERKRVEAEFRRDVRRAKEKGHTFEEIRDAAGYKSISPVQNILNKK